MITSEYVEQVRDDLLKRVQTGTILVNDKVSVAVQAAAITEHPLAGIKNATALKVTAPQIKGVPVITNVKLLTQEGRIVAQKNLQMETAGAQFLSLTFVIDVKGGV